MAEWPDHRGQAVAIVASGPSVKKAEVEALKGRLPVLAIKKNVELAPWADAVYGCDYPWWKSVRGLTEFKGLRLAYDPKCAAEFGCRKVDIALKNDAILTGTVGLVGSGGNSGFQALNLEVQWGAKRILLLGFDMQDRSGTHWYGRNGAVGMSNPGAQNFRRWIAAFVAASKQLEEMGVEVICASRISDLRCFPRHGVGETLERWGV